MKQLVKITHSKSQTSPQARIVIPQKFLQALEWENEDYLLLEKDGNSLKLFAIEIKRRT